MPSFWIGPHGVAGSNRDFRRIQASGRPEECERPEQRGSNYLTTFVGTTITVPLITDRADRGAPERAFNA